MKKYLLLSSLICFLFCGCKKELSSADPEKNDTLTSAANINKLMYGSSNVSDVEHAGLDFYQSTYGSSGTLMLTFKYNGTATSGYVSVGGTSMGSADDMAYLINLYQGTITCSFPVYSIQNGNITASLKIGTVTTKISTINIYNVPSSDSFVGYSMPDYLHVAGVSVSSNENNPGYGRYVDFYFTWDASYQNREPKAKFIITIGTGLTNGRISGEITSFFGEAHPSASNAVVSGYISPLIPANFYYQILCYTGDASSAAIQGYLANPDYQNPPWHSSGLNSFDLKVYKYGNGIFF